MSKEFECKYKLKCFPDLEVMKDYSVSFISQFYTKSELHEVRYRCQDNKYYRQSKSAGDLIREESAEEEITFVEWMNALDNIIDGSRVISKARYKIPLDNGLVAELDIYDNELSDLNVVEVEFSRVTEDMSLLKDMYDNFKKPYWFGEEVTFDKRFKNRNLATMPSAKLQELIYGEKSYIYELKS